MEDMPPGLKQFIPLEIKDGGHTLDAFTIQEVLFSAVSKAEVAYKAQEQEKKYHAPSTLILSPFLLDNMECEMCH